MARFALLLLPIIGITMAAQAADPPPVFRTVVEQRTARMFDQADSDHDGVLTKAEYVAATIAVARARGGTPTPRGLALVEMQFDAFDLSHTGRIRRSDFIAEKMAQFDAMDLNHDGIVSAGESRKAADALRRQMKAAAEPAKAKP